MSRRSMLTSSADVIRCLITYTDWWQPASSSVLVVGAARRSTALGSGLHPGVLDTLDERSELMRRVLRLEDRDRRVLFLWYVAQLPLSEVGRAIGVSQRQCQRVRARAVQRIVELGEDAEEVA
ncbi:MAG: sigma factor-like helix-turn-helix DNA-binding protein [Actinomycetota bacterium]